VNELDPAVIHERIENMAQVLMHGGQSEADAYMLAVIADVTSAPDRTPITGCEHAPSIEDPGRKFIDATMRTLSCDACTVNAFELDPDAERLMNQDVWCDLCGVDTGRPVDQGGGTSGHVRTYGKFLLRIWTCIDCERYLTAGVDQITRVPRNAPCPCGSGRKFKRCHGRS
jgi:SEC-C motif